MNDIYNIDTSKLSPYKCQLGWKNKSLRLLWGIVRILLFCPFRPRQFNVWRSFVLRLLGAKIGKGCAVHSSSEVWAPWNLVMGDYVCIAPHTIVYNVDKITIGSKVTISQYSHLCTASHDITSIEKPLTTKPITIESLAWVCADAFVGPGVTVGKGAVVAARAVVVKDVEPWAVVGGNPAVFIKKRVLKER